MSGSARALKLAILPLRAAPAGRTLSWLVLSLAALLSLGLAGAITEIAGRQHDVARTAGPEVLLHRPPVLAGAALGPKSAALGTEPAYLIRKDPAGLRAENPAQGFGERFGSAEVQVLAGATRVGFDLRSIGYGEHLHRAGAADPAASANRVDYQRAGVSEWYSNGPLGLEQGFTIPRAPASGGEGPLTLSIAISGNAPVSSARGGQALTLGRDGSQVLGYDGLSATDATRRVLRSWLEVRGRVVLIRVDTRGARYPVRIDPFINGGSVGAGRAVAVAMSADGQTALFTVGGRRERDEGDEWTEGYGVYVGVRSGSGWVGQGPPLIGGLTIANNGGLPYAVALSADGDTALVGAPAENDRAGAVHVFTRTGSTWSEQGPKLTAAPEDGAGEFGETVALSADGDSALVGAPQDGGGLGAAWLFRRMGSTWVEQQKLTGAGEQGEGAFGAAVALSADGRTALIGAPGDGGGVGAAWVFTRAGFGFFGQRKLTGAGESGEGAFGASVALSADGGTLLIGAPMDDEEAGAAWVFTRAGFGLTQEQILTGSSTEKSDFGQAVALSANGASAFVCAPELPLAPTVRGAVLVFARSAQTWTQTEELDALRPHLPPFRLLSGLGIAISADATSALAIEGATTSGGSSPNVPRSAVEYTVPVPSVTSVGPAGGPRSGGTAVTIDGLDFEGTTAVSFGSTPAASYTVTSSTSITAVSPAGAGAVDVRVRTPEGTSAASPADEFTYGPAVTSVASGGGPRAGGTQVTITGSDLAGATQVRFGARTAASFAVTSPTSITAVSPAGAGTVDVRVRTSEGTSAASPADEFTYGPAVSTVAPDEGPQAGGTQVTISGSDLADATQVRFGARPAESYTVTSPTSVTAVSPAGAGTVDVTVRTPEGTSAEGAGNLFNYRAPPSVLTEAASGLTRARVGADLNATLNPNGAPVSSCKFEYGATTAYGQTTSCPELPASRETQPTGAHVSLPCCAPPLTEYHFRIVASGPGGTSYGADETFQTPPEPIVTTGAATAITATSATLNGIANYPNCYFEYGTTELDSEAIPCEQKVSYSTTPVAVSAKAIALSPGTTYYFRLVAPDGPGVPVFGADASFETGPAP